MGTRQQDRGQQKRQIAPARSHCRTLLSFLTLEEKLAMREESPVSQDRSLPGGDLEVTVRTVHVDWVRSE